jgi:tmRNA-binding protein
VQLSRRLRRPARGEIWLVNAHIPEYSGGNRSNHEPKRVRKLLLHKREIEKLIGAVARAHMTVVPLELYFNERGPREAADRARQGQDRRRQAAERCASATEARAGAGDARAEIAPASPSPPGGNRQFRPANPRLDASRAGP